MKKWLTRNGDIYRAILSGSEGLVAGVGFGSG